jgi:predicted DNA-binding transcriptional regulator AlpA
MIQAMSQPCDATPKHKKARVAQPLAAAALPDALLTEATVMVLATWSRSTLRRRIAAGKFPPPLRDGRVTHWRSADVMAALRAL